MFETTVWCPFCQEDFAGQVWIGGNCQRCGEVYWWEEDCTEDYSDCWPMTWWDFEGHEVRKTQAEVSNG